MIEKSPFFSVIMPVYNSAEFLNDSISSVLNQSFHNFELIIADDHSTDDSWSICQKFAGRDKRIKLTQTPLNKGAAGARNKGLDLAVGQYISFVDADDTIDPDFFSTAISYLKDSSIDCVKFGVIEEYYSHNNLINSRSCPLDTHVYTGNQNIFQKTVEMELVPLFGYLWNGIYKSDIIRDHNVKLNESLKVNEDFEFNMRYFQYVNKLQCVNYTGYHYAKRSNSSLSSKRNDDYYQLHMMKIELFLDRYKILECEDQQTLQNIF